MSLCSNRPQNSFTGIWRYSCIHASRTLRSQVLSYWDSGRMMTHGEADKWGGGATWPVSLATITMLRPDTTPSYPLPPPATTPNADINPKKLNVLQRLEYQRPSRRQSRMFRNGHNGLLYICGAVLAKKFPDTVSDLTTYQLLIIQTYWDYDKPAWHRYDKTFRD